MLEKFDHIPTDNEEIRTTGDIAIKAAQTMNAFSEKISFEAAIQMEYDLARTNNTSNLDDVTWDRIAANLNINPNNLSLED